MRPKVAIAVTNILIILGFVAFIAALVPWFLVGTTPNGLIATVIAAVLWAMALVIGGFTGSPRRQKRQSHGTPLQANEELEAEYAYDHTQNEDQAAREVDSPRHQAPPD